MPVTLYAGFSGTGTSYAVPRNVPDLGVTPIGRNQARSVTVTGGDRIVLFKRRGFEGNAAFLDQSVANLRDVPVDLEDRNFNRTVASVLVNPLTVPVSTKLITSGGRFPGGIASVAEAIDRLNAGLRQANDEVWGPFLIRFELVTAIFTVEQPRYFDVKSSELREALNLQRDPERLNITIVNDITRMRRGDPIGRCGTPALLRNLGCAVEADYASDGVLLGHEFGHHFGLDHVEGTGTNLMNPVADGVATLTARQIAKAHRVIGNRRPRYRIGYGT